MNNVDALKVLYAAMGGTASTVANISTIAEMIAEIAKIVPSGSGSSLPTVDDSDNGKILMVVEGEWAVADAPKELPTVSAENNGKVLKVVDGAWAIGDDATE